MGYGNYVMVLHKGNLVTLYGHLEHVTVNEGQEIKQGTVIGYMGNTGISYGAHLHFEIRKYNRSLENINLHNKDYFGFIDPEPYLNTGLPIGEEKYERVQIGSFYRRIMQNVLWNICKIRISGNNQKIWNVLQSAGRRIHHPY